MGISEKLHGGVLHEIATAKKVDSNLAHGGLPL